MVNLTLTNCECSCESAKIVEAVIKQSGLQYWLQVGLVALIMLLVILGLIIGFRKIQEKDDED